MPRGTITLAVTEVTVTADLGVTKRSTYGVWAKVTGASKAATQNLSGLLGTDYEPHIYWTRDRAARCAEYEAAKLKKMGWKVKVYK